MSVFMWKFNTIPDPKIVEGFIDVQVPLLSPNANYITGGHSRPVVDLMKVEHNCGAVNLEFQLNGIEGQSGDVFCFPDIIRATWMMKVIPSSTAAIPADISTAGS